MYIYILENIFCTLQIIRCHLQTHLEAKSLHDVIPILASACYFRGFVTSLEKSHNQVFLTRVSKNKDSKEVRQNYKKYFIEYEHLSNYLCWQKSYINRLVGYLVNEVYVLFKYCIAQNVINICVFCSIYSFQMDRTLQFKYLQLCKYILIKDTTMVHILT